jgi:hypothetical protein
MAHAVKSLLQNWMVLHEPNGPFHLFNFMHNSEYQSASGISQLQDLPLTQKSLKNSQVLGMI